MRKQQYIDITRDSAGFDAYRFDLIQPKYDGHFRSIEVDGCLARMFSAGGKLQETRPCCLPAGHYLGELLDGTEWSQARADRGRVVLFDIDGPGNYHERYDRLARAVAANPEQAISGVTDWTKIVPTMAIDCADEFWRQWVQLDGFEGVIYRRSGDTFRGAIIGREKRVQTWEYTYSRQLDGARAVFVDSTTGAETITAINLPADISTTPAGTIAELGALSRFRSGKLRNGFFIRWRSDKTA